MDTTETREPRTTPAPFPGVDFNTIAVTPHRKTQVVIGLPEYRKTRQAWGRTFRGYQMASANGAPAGQNLNVALLPSGSWCIASWEMQMQFERQEAAGNLFGPTGATLAVEIAPGFDTFVSQNQIPGVTYDSNVVSLGCYFCRKRKLASGDWHAELTADLSNFAKPSLPTQNVPMRRVAHHTGSAPTNGPVYVRFLGPGAPLATTDAFLTFYFGGPVATTWPNSTATTSGGEFALTLFGDGMASLWERTKGAPGAFNPSDPWRLLDQWRWETRGKVAGPQHVIGIIPEGTDTLSFVGTGTPHLFRANSRSAGYAGKAAMIGSGPMRLDMREDLRLPFQFGTQTFAPGGFGGAPGGTALYGYPIKIPFRMAAGTKIFAALDHPGVPGGPPGSIDVAIHDAKTAELLSGPAADGSYQTLHASQRDYYAIYTPSTTSSFYTPFLRGCEFRVDGVVALATPTPYSGGNVMEVAITGPDVEIDCETASVLIEDLQGTLMAGPAPPAGGSEGGLWAHAEQHAQIQTGYDKTDATKQWILFDGVVVRATALRQGRNLVREAFGPVPPATTLTPRAWPSPKWFTIRLSLAGQWHRLAQQSPHVFQIRDYSRDPSGAVDASGVPLPWQVIDILTDTLKQAGYDAAQIHMVNPDGGTTGGPRLFANGKDPQDQFLFPGARVVEFLHHMSRDYLGALLLWDTEAKPYGGGAGAPTGRWILVYPPVLSGSYTTLFSFRTTQVPPNTSGIDNRLPVHLPGAWPTGTTFVTQYSKWVTPPEANLFFVATAPASNIPAHDPKAAPGQDLRYVKDGAVLSAAVGVNWRSTAFEGYPAPDPASLDWVPYGVKPYADINPALYNSSVEQSNEACRYMCRRRMNAGAYGLRWFQWVSPLTPYFDPDPIYAGGPRKFRTFDLVQYNEDGTLYNVCLTSCNPQIGLPEGDLAQWMDCSGFVLPAPLSY